jgi:hypothetical protein
LGLINLKNDPFFPFSSNSLNSTLLVIIVSKTFWILGFMKEIPQASVCQSVVSAKEEVSAGWGNRHSWWHFAYALVWKNKALAVAHQQERNEIR